MSRRYHEGITAMQVAFLGGASGVGASCLAIELAEQWFVVDAGVRVDHKADPLPDLAQLEGKDIRAIFVTHAHADHIGALPLLHRAFPTTPIFTSRGNASTTQTLRSAGLGSHLWLTAPSQSTGRGTAACTGRRGRAGPWWTCPHSLFWTGQRPGNPFAFTGGPGTGPDTGVSHLC